MRNSKSFIGLMVSLSFSDPGIRRLRSVRARQLAEYRKSINAIRRTTAESLKMLATLPEASVAAAYKKGLGLTYGRLDEAERRQFADLAKKCAGQLAFTENHYGGTITVSATDRQHPEPCIAD